MRKLWGGAFEGESEALVDAFGQSILSDLEFWKEDVTGSIAHARMLGRQGILTSDEAATLISGLEQILAEGPQKLSRDVEDIHTAVEMRLGDIVGEVAGKLHTARSRNDQVATDTRLYMRSRLEALQGALKGLQNTLYEVAQKHQETLLPGYTHQQRAQPITLGYHLLAHFWSLQRHGWRASNLLTVTNYSPLGSAALAGSGFPIDRGQTSDELGFIAPIPNALDATSDRSHVLDMLHLCALIMLDLSRVSQELILWSGYEFGFVKLGDGVTTGSSIMPQKRNPDMAELIRGRTGRAIGNWTAFAATMKGLVLGYNRDTQDDKPGMFESIQLTLDSLGLVRLMLESATWQTERMSSTLRGDFSTATDLADFLASSGIPFRQAHEIVGKVVRACSDRQCGLEELDLAALQAVDPAIPPGAEAVLQPAQSALRRKSYGAPGDLLNQLQLAGERLAAENYGSPY